MAYNDSMAKAFAPAEAHYKSIVMHQTWGHLFPDKDQYKGKIRIIRGMYQDGQGTIIDEKNLPNSSPWWFDAITEFAYEASQNMEHGEVAEFDIQVDIVACEQELTPEEIEEGYEPDTWQEIHIKELRKTVIVKAW